MSDKEYCEAEAEQAGMISSEDIQEYVLQCLEEIQRQSDYGMDPDLNGDSEYDDTGDQ